MNYPNPNGWPSKLFHSPNGSLTDTETVSIALTSLMPLNWHGEEANAERLTETMRSMSLLDWSGAIVPLDILQMNP
jgi:hypothetical protein